MTRELRSPLEDEPTEFAGKSDTSTHPGSELRVVLLVLGWREDQEVIRPIVELVTVDVMDFLATPERATEIRLHYDPVFEFSLPDANLDPAVASLNGGCTHHEFAAGHPCVLAGS